MHKFRELSLRTQLILLAILLTLPCFGIIIFNGYNQLKYDINQTAVETQKLADNIATEQQNLSQVSQGFGKLIAQLPEVKHRKISKVQAILANILKDNPEYLSILITDRSGIVWASAIPLNQTVSLADRRYFKNALASKRFSSGEYVISKSTGKPTFTFGYPFVNEQGEIAGVIVFSLNLDHLKNLLKRSQLNLDANYILVDHKGIIICRGHEADGLVGTALRADILKSMEASPDNATYDFMRNDGDKRIITHRKLRLNGEQNPYLYIRTGISYKIAVAKAFSDIMNDLALLVPFVFIAFTLVFYIGKRSIVDRINVLDSAARQLASGNLPVNIASLVKGGELGRLGETFDNMAQQLKVREQELIENALLLAELNENLEDRVYKAVNELRQKDQILIQQSRLAAMGEMIHNIAHQWRQPLNTLGLIIQQFQVEYELGLLDKELLDKSVDDVKLIIQQMSRTIDDFRNFFKPDKEKEEFTITHVVTNAIQLVKADFNSHQIKIITRYLNDPIIHGYPNEYSQVVINILSNAKEALLASKTVNPQVIITSSAEEDKSVVIISDNAGGIPDDIIFKVFDPHFSTKGPQGTGIGLFMSKNIIEKSMNGSLSVRNNTEGAEFKIVV